MKSTPDAVSALRRTCASGTCKGPEQAEIKVLISSFWKKKERERKRGTATHDLRGRAKSMIKGEGGFRLREVIGRRV